MAESYDERKENIKRIALQVFIKYGYYKTTMDDIAEGVGIKKNSLYYYFPNKESLFEEILDEEAHKMLNTVKDSVAGKTSAEEKVKTFFNGFLCYGKNKKSHISVSLETMIEFGQVVEEYFFEYICEMRNYLSSLFDEGQNSGEFRTIDSKKTSEILMNFVSSYQREQVRKTKSNAFEDIDFTKIQKEISGLLDLVLNGIKKV